ncbi:hypothetical protein ACCO45_004161 [Purpureocillium lilacinum]|uniref:Uncharacterized protein n=1 Tax=Purpureocillium lilacinum TaxID=33203 RepID=A0ACC4E2T0_PURLI
MSIPTSGIPSLSNADPDPAAARPPLSPGSACRPYHVAFQQAVFDRLRSPSSLGKAAQSLLPEDERQFSCPSLGAQPQRATTQIVRVDEPDFPLISDCVRVAGACERALRRTQAPAG